MLLVIFAGKLYLQPLNPHKLPCYLENSILNYKQSESLQSLKSPLVFVSVKSCGRLPDCRVLSPPELALEVIW